MSDTLAETRDPERRRVVLTEERWAHILERHPELARDMDAIMDVVTEPEHRELDRASGRVRYYRRGPGPSRWVRVVVDYRGPIAAVWTSFPNRRDPVGWSPET